jgi:hypothetical protein
LFGADPLEVVIWRQFRCAAGKAGIDAFGHAARGGIDMPGEQIAEDADDESSAKKGFRHESQGKCKPMGSWWVGMRAQDDGMVTGEISGKKTGIGRVGAARLGRRERYEPDTGFGAFHRIHLAGASAVVAVWASACAGGEHGGDDAGGGDVWAPVLGGAGVK